VRKLDATLWLVLFTAIVMFSAGLSSGAADPYSEPDVLRPSSDEPAPPHSAPQCSTTKVPTLDPAVVRQLADSDITLRALEPLGAEVFGLDLRTVPSQSVLLRYSKVKWPSEATLCLEDKAF
jgi:hypothetical protein